MKALVIGLVLFVSMTSIRTTESLSFIVGFIQPEKNEVTLKFQDDQDYLVVGSGIDMEVIRSGIYTKGQITVEGINCIIMDEGKNLYTVAISSVEGKPGEAQIKVFWKQKSSDKDKLVISQKLEIRSGDQGF